jgi:hypothetical protein
MDKRIWSCSFIAVAMLLSATASLQVKGGEEETGPYDLVANWPQPFAREGYIMGSIAGIFADTPNRIFVAMRGEVKLPAPLPRGFEGFWGSMGKPRGTMPPSPEMHNCVFTVDSSGKLVESWTDWDRLFAPDPGGFGGPHTVKISPYDPDRHVWVINEMGQQIYKFSNDGKRLVLTLGERAVEGNDDKHFGRPQDIAWSSDGSMYVVDGFTNSRIVQFDKTGAFVKSWGTKGDGPGQFKSPHAIAIDRDGRIYVADRGNSRVQIFDADGKYLDMWPNIRFPDAMLVTPDSHVWVSDGTTGKLLQYDSTGKLLSSWGVNGTFPGAHWEFHAFSVDSDGNLYTADSYAGRAQKFRPKAGARPEQLIRPTPQTSSR